MNRISGITKSLLLISLVFLIIPSIVSAAPVGKFTYVSGQVDVLRPSPPAIPVKLGDPVYVGDAIRAKSNSKAEITFTNGNIVRVAPNTRIDIKEYIFEEAQSSSILKLLRGKVQAIVLEKIAKRIASLGEANRFEIHTPTAIAGVRGTNFHVSFQRNQSAVYFEEGTGYAYNPKYPDEVVMVTAGNICIIPEDQPAQPQRPATDAEKKIYSSDVAPTEEPGAEKTEGIETAGEITSLEEVTAAETPAPTSLVTETPTSSTDIPTSPPITETIPADSTPPVITISGPPYLTNLSTATFNVASDETVTFNYELGTWGAISPNTTSDTIDLSGLPEGTYTLTITATDQVGNESTTSYTWTIDQTPPFIETAPPSITNSPTASFGFNEPVTYSYIFDDDPQTPGTGSTLLLSGLSEDSHTIIIESATDLAGNLLSSEYSYTWTTDYGAPTVSLSGGPPDPTNQHTAEFSASSSEPDVTYSYTLDGNPVSSTNLSNLLEGEHIFTVTVTDTAGNTSSPASYIWTTDYTGPVVTITPIQASPSKGTVSDIDITLSSNEPATYSYRIDDGEWTQTEEPSLTLQGLEEGSHIFEVASTDALENPSLYSLPFDLSRYNLTGSFYGCIAGVYGSATGEVAGVSEQDWGGWKIYMSGNGNPEPNPKWTLYAGGRSSDTIESNNNGYWLLIADGSTDFESQTLSATSNLKYLSHDRFGTGTGILTGSYEGSYYELTDSGLGTYTESPLAFNGSFIYGKFIYIDPDSGYIPDEESSITGLIGGITSPWSGSPSSILMGEYSNPSNLNLWDCDISGRTSDNDGAFYISGGGISVNNSTEGMAIGLYIKPDGTGGYEAGYLISSPFAIKTYPEISMWEASPTMIASSGVPTIIRPERLYWGSPYLNVDWHEGSIGGSITGSMRLESLGLNDQNWGRWMAWLGGEYTTTPPTDWTATVGGYEYDEYNFYWIGSITGTDWSSGGRLAGEISGKFLADNETGTFSGEILGTHNLISGGSWQAFGVGTYMENTAPGIDLAFGGDISSENFEWEPPFLYVVGNRNLIGLMGGTDSLWTGSPSFLSLGTYSSLDSGALWGVDVTGWTSDDSAFLGITGGIVLDENLEGRLLAIYIKDTGETGYMYSKNVNGSLYPEIGMYELGGNLASVSMGITSILPDNLSWDSLYGDIPSLLLSKAFGTIEGDITGEIGVEVTNLTDQNWGIWWASSRGSYATDPSTDWTAIIGGEIYDNNFDIVGYCTADIDITEVNLSDNKIAGSIRGYWTNIEPDAPCTGIMIGETLGTFDPDYYTSVSLGVNVETNKFLEMASTTDGRDKLQKLNIPCVEVGRVNLSGKGNNLTVNMNDVIFFAPSTGARPSIWATNSVNGSYTANPNINVSVPLSGSGLRTNFTVREWDTTNNVWLSTIQDGRGNITGGSANVRNLQFQGAAAGKINQPAAGKFSGTAAGIAR